MIPCHLRIVTMKNNYQILIVASLLLMVILFNSCSPRVTTYNNVYIPDYNPDLVDYSVQQTIVKKKDLFGLAFEYRGAVMVDQPQTYWRRSDCNEEVAMQILRTEAAKAGATLINIIDEIKPGESSSYERSACYRCKADFYKTNMDSITLRVLKQTGRIKTYLNDDDTLSWKSFIKMDSTIIPLEYFVNLQAEAGGVSVWTGNFKEFKVVPVFYNDISKVKSSFATTENLSVLLQLAMISKYHAIQTEQQLNEESGRSEGMIQSIIDTNLMNLNNEKESFLKETDYGRDKVAVEKWIVAHPYNH